MKMRIAVAILTFTLGAVSALADLELTVDREYPRRLELKIPVHEDSEFAMRTSFGDGEYFAVSGHVGRITGVGTHRNYNLSFGYQYKLGKSSGSSIGASETGPLDGSVTVRAVASIYAANPRFVIREVDPPPSPHLALTNVTTLAVFTNEMKAAAQQPSAGDAATRAAPEK